MFWIGHIRRDLVPDHQVEIGVGALEVEKEIRREKRRDLVVGAQKKEELKQAESHESEREKETETEKENDQKAALLTVHHQVEVAAVVPRKKIRRRIASRESVAHEAGVQKGNQRRRGLAVRKETEIRGRRGKSVQGAAIAQVLLGQDQKVGVQIRNKKSPKAGW